MFFEASLNGLSKQYQIVAKQRRPLLTDQIRAIREVLNLDNQKLCDVLCSLASK